MVVDFLKVNSTYGDLVLLLLFIFTTIFHSLIYCVHSELFLVFHYVYIAFVRYNFSVLGRFTLDACGKILPQIVFHDL